MRSFLLKSAVLLAVATFLGLGRVAGQTKYMHSAGITYLYGWNETTFQAMPGLTYIPRLHVCMGDQMAVALATAPTLGFYGSFNSRTGGAGGFGIDIPVNLQLHLGAGATPDSDANVGMYIGVGAGWTWLGSASYWGGESGSFIGPGAELGLNAWIRDRPFGLRFKYNKNVKTDGGSVIGIGFVYHLGLL